MGPQSFAGLGLVFGALSLAACGAEKEFVALPSIEGDRREFLIRFEGENVVASELKPGVAVRASQPEQATLYWVSISESALEHHFASRPELAAQLRFGLAPPGCGGSHRLPDAGLGVPVRSLDAEVARLSPGEVAFSDLGSEDLGSSSAIGRLSVLSEDLRTCRPRRPVEFRPVDFGIQSPAQLGGLYHHFEDGRVVASDALVPLVYLLREGEPAPLDVWELRPHTEADGLHDLVARDEGFRTELALLSGGAMPELGNYLRVSLEGERFGPTQAVPGGQGFTEFVQGDEGEVVLIGHEGLLGVHELGTTTVTRSRPFAPADLEAVFTLDSPRRYIVGDGVGTLYIGDVRDPTSMVRRPFALGGIREVFAFDRPSGPWLYAREAQGRVFHGPLDSPSPGATWPDATLLPPESLATCRHELDACLEPRSLEPIRSLSRLEGRPGLEPRLIIEFTRCSAITLLEPSTGCAFGLVPPSPSGGRIKTILPRGENLLLLLESGEVFEFSP